MEVSTGSDSDIGKFEDVEVVIKNKDGTTAAVCMLYFVYDRRRQTEFVHMLTNAWYLCA